MDVVRRYPLGNYKIGFLEALSDFNHLKMLADRHDDQAEKACNSFNHCRPLISLEAATRFELVNGGFADLC